MVKNLENLLVGFTGTRKGMTAYQKDTLSTFLSEHPLELHLGDAIGADSEAFDLMVQANNTFGWKRPTVLIGYPSDRPEYRANRDYDMEHHPMPPMDRNRLIVERTQLLIGCPRSTRNFETGTWRTVGFALERRTDVYVIRPDGCVEEM